MNTSPKAQDAPQFLFRIRDWDSNYENHRSRELKQVSYVPVQNKMDGDGYVTLLDHKRGPLHYAAWMAIVMIASRCKQRGTLVGSDGTPYDSKSLSRISRIPQSVFDEAIPRLVNETRWLEAVECRESIADVRVDGAEEREISALSARESAGSSRHARARASVPFPSIPLCSSSEEEKPEVSQTALTVVEDPATNPVAIFEVCAEIYRLGGLPVPESQRDHCVRLILGVDPPSRRLRIPRYAAWCFQSGRWPNPAKTMAFLTLLQGTNWDVDLTPRVIPTAREPDSREGAIDAAVRRLREERNAANGN